MQARVVVVTGAFGALGSAVVEAFAQKGERLALIDRATESADVKRRLGDQSLVLGDVDIATPSTAQRAMDRVAAECGGIDVLVNVAGGFQWETLSAGDVATWDVLYALNLKTAVSACKAALPHLIARRGKIINIGASAVARAGAGMGAYAASKAGVIKLTEALADELKDQYVNVNAVLPSILDTPANRRESPQADFSRWVQPADLAAVIVFLASESSRGITGASIPVTGRV